MKNYHSDFVSHLTNTVKPCYKYIINDGSNLDFKVTVKVDNVWKKTKEYSFATLDELINNLSDITENLTKQSFVIFCFRKTDADPTNRQMAKRFNKLRKSTEKVCVSNATAGYPYEMRIVFKRNMVHDSIKTIYNLFGQPSHELEACRYGTTLRNVAHLIKNDAHINKLEHSIFFKDKSDVSTILLMIGSGIHTYNVIEHFNTWEELDQKYNVTETLKNVGMDNGSN